MNYREREPTGGFWFGGTESSGQFTQPRSRPEMMATKRQLMERVKELENAIHACVRDCAEKTTEILRLEDGIQEIAILNADYMNQIRSLYERIREIEKRCQRSA